MTFATLGTLISIIVPCFKQAQYLSEALRSVLGQTFAEWECIIVDDGSPDNTEEIAKQWCEKDMRFKYLKKKNGGLSSARNAGIAATAGKYILPLDADDRIAESYVEKAVEIMEADNGVTLVYGEAEYFGEMSGKWELPAFSIQRLAFSNLIYCSAIFRRTDFEKYGPYDETFVHGREDWDLWLSILKHGGKVVRIPEVMFYYRKKAGESMVDNFRNKELVSHTQQVIYKKHEDFYNSLFGDPISAYRERELLRSGLASLKRSKFYKISSWFVTLKNNLIGK